MDSHPTFYVNHHNTRPFTTSHEWLGRICYSYKEALFLSTPSYSTNTLSVCGPTISTSSYGDIEFNFDSPPQKRPSLVTKFKRSFQDEPEPEPGYILATNVTRYYLTNEQQVLTDILADDERRARVEKWCKHFKHVHMIVGYLVAENMNVRLRSYRCERIGPSPMIVAYEFKVIKRTMREASKGIQVQPYGIKGYGVFVEEVREDEEGEDSRRIELNEDGEEVRLTKFVLASTVE